MIMLGEKFEMESRNEKSQTTSPVVVGTSKDLIV